MIYKPCDAAAMLFVRKASFPVSTLRSFQGPLQGESQPCAPLSEPAPQLRQAHSARPAAPSAGTRARASGDSGNFQRHQGWSLDRSSLGKPLPTLLPDCDWKVHGAGTGRGPRGERGHRGPGCCQERRPGWGGWAGADRKPQASAEVEVAFQAGTPGKGGEATEKAAASDHDRG